jgi:aldose sugar dehydrogenase
MACGSDSLPVIDLGPETGATDEIQARVLVSGLDTPWDLAMAPDGFLWVTERRGVISRVNPANGDIQEVGRIGVHEESESGLMGMALHPDFPGQPFIYLFYSYQERFSGGDVILNRLIRMPYAGTRLGDEEILIDGIPGGRIHDGARLAIGPDRYLYVTIGDTGQQPSAQDTSSLIGKVLRLTLDGQPAPDNPFGNEVYSYGHRNPQGIVSHPTAGHLYVTEHGPSDNDELNLLVPGGNFGWPNVRGFCDNDVANLDELAFCASETVIEPLKAYTPTVAPAGMDFYDSDLIPAWRGSILFTTLKASSLYRVELSIDGTIATDEEILFKSSFGRLRDVLVAPDGRVYLATSNRDGRGNPIADDDRIIVISP